MTSTPSPTPVISPWLVGPTSHTVIEDLSDGYNTMLHISNDIGVYVQPNSVVVDLFDENCVNEQNKTGLSVNIIEIDGPNLGSGDPFSYHIAFDNTKFGTNPGELIHFTGIGSEGNSKGSIKFCTRVTASELGVRVSFIETNFDVGFDLTNNTFLLDNVSVESNNPDDFTNNVDVELGVDACHCTEDFICYENGAGPSIGNNEYLSLCLQPTGSQSGKVYISNFNLMLSAGSITYSPVSFGDGTWNPNLMTSTELNEEKNVLQILTIIISDFFILEDKDLKIMGNAFLHFNAKNEVYQQYAIFGTSAELKNYEQRASCFTQILQKVKKVFY